MGLLLLISQFIEELDNLCDIDDIDGNESDSSGGSYDDDIASTGIDPLDKFSESESEAIVPELPTNPSQAQRHSRGIGQSKVLVRRLCPYYFSREAAHDSLQSRIPTN
jgi:hypothetical protein